MIKSDKMTDEEQRQFDAAFERIKELYPQYVPANQVSLLGGMVGIMLCLFAIAAIYFGIAFFR